MRLYFLGTGTPTLDLSRNHASLVVECNQSYILFDAGRGITAQLLKLGLNPLQIEAVFITHHHYDHICDLGEFIMANWHNGRVDPLFIYGPPGTYEIVNTLLERVFARDIAFTMMADPEMPDIRQLIKVRDVLAGMIFSGAGYSVRAEQVKHGSALDLPSEDWSCLGYRLQCEQKTVAISGDTVDCPGLDNLASNADVLVQCCYLAESELGSPTAEWQASHIIASSRQAGRIAMRNHVKRLILTHIPPKPQLILDEMIEDVRKEFSGEIIMAEDLMVLDI
jgi:ribonuclease Z